MKTKIKRQSWAWVLLLMVILCTSCNPDDYNPGDEEEPSYPENGQTTETIN
mgnify:CR=1 FL=1